MTLVCDGPAIVHICIPVVQKTCAPVVRQGLPSAHTLVCSGIQLPADENVQLCGVSTPNAAAVADATCGLANEEHIPKLPTFAAEASCIVATGFPSHRTLLWLVTFRFAGAAPIGHVITAPSVTKALTFLPPFQSNL
jgi:hypothetical protein